MSADALAIVAAFLFALAAVLQQRGAVTQGAGGMSIGFFLNLLRSPAWLLGSSALLVGYAVQGAALGKGRLIIIQPLLVSTIVFALPLGILLTHQVVTRRDWGAAAGVVAALAAFIVVGDPAAGIDDGADWKWAVSTVVVCILAAGVMVLGRGARPARRAAALGTVAGMLFGMSASLAKPVVEEWDDSGISAVAEDWRTWALVIMGVVAFLIQQGALATGQLAPAVATTSLANPVVASILGIVILEERLAGGLLRKSVAVGALVVAALCAIALAQHDQERAAQEGGPDAGPEPEPEASVEPA
ncbi:MAG TPA: DMT family transporter [Miltoncostaea sp.]|nr:DMT family transporter [Miltoncostaea sp.]